MGTKLNEMFRFVETFFETDDSNEYRPNEYTRGMVSHSTRKTVISTCVDAGLPEEWIEVRAGTNQSKGRWIPSYYKGTTHTDEQLGRAISGTA